MKSQLDQNRIDEASTDEEKTLLEEMMDRRDAAVALFDECAAAWRDIRKEAEADLEFYNSHQWDKGLITAGQVKKEPTLTVNKLPQFVQQIEGELRSREINITVSPSDEDGSDEVADIFNGLIRHIQQDSHASTAYIHAAGEAGAMVPGFGFVRVDIEAVNKKSWSENKKLVINSVFDPFTVLPDFGAQTPNFADSNYWFEISDYPADQYRFEFPRSEMASLDVTATGVNQDSWGLNQNSMTREVRVVRYWYQEQITSVQYKLEDGTVVDDMVYEKPKTDNVEADLPMTGRMPFPKDSTGAEKIVSRKREVLHTKIKWMDINAVEILREGDWPGEHFPFVAVTGPQTVVNGRRDIRGLIRYAKDSQKMLNYMASSIARRIASSNKAPWIADKKSIAPYQKVWDSANTENWSVLPYDAWRDNPAQPGELIANPKPERADQTSQITDLLQAAQHWNDELKATVGIYDAQLGNMSNQADQSGKAISTLTQQGQNANLHFSDNLVTSITQLAIILVDLIPKIYAGPRVIKIVNPDSSQEIIKINQIFTVNGQSKKHDLTTGEYGVFVAAGPAYATKKQEALNQILDLTKVDPTLTPVLQDLIVGSMDFKDSAIAKDRLVKLFAQNFPGLQSNNQNEDVPPQARAAMAQQGKMIDQLTQELTALHQEYQKDELIIKTDKIKNDGQMALLKQEGVQNEAIEKLRTERDAAAASEKMQLEIVKTKLDHIEAMHKVLVPHMMKEQAEGKAVASASHSGLQARAEGGPQQAGQPYLVGENGPEIIVPKQSGTVIPNPNTDSPHSVSQQRFNDLMTKANGIVNTPEDETHQTASGSMHVGLAVPSMLSPQQQAYHDLRIKAGNMYPGNSNRSPDQEQFSGMMQNAGQLIPRAQGGPIVGTDDIPKYAQGPSMGGDDAQINGTGPQPGGDSIGRSLPVVAARQTATATSAQQAMSDQMKKPEQGLGTDMTSELGQGAGTAITDYATKKGAPAGLAAAFGTAADVGVNALPMLISAAIPTKSLGTSQAVSDFTDHLNYIGNVIRDAGKSVEDQIVAKAKSVIGSGQTQINDILGSNLDPTTWKLATSGQLTPDKIMNQAKNAITAQRASMEKDLSPFADMNARLGSNSISDMKDYLGSAKGMAHSAQLERLMTKYQQPILGKLNLDAQSASKVPMAVGVGAATETPTQ